MINSAKIMDMYSSSFSDLRNNFIGQDITWAKKLREKAFEQFCKDGIPNQNVEEWNVFPYRDLRDNFFSASSNPVDQQSINKLNSKDINCSIRMIFFNGKMVKLDIDKPIEGLQINSLKYFMDNSPDLLEGKIPDASFYSERRLSNVVDSRPQGMVALNAAFYQDGVVILIDKNTVVPGHIEIVHIGDAKTISMSPVRSVIFLSENSKCEVIERIFPTCKNTHLHLSNHVTDIQLSSQSSLTYLRLVDGNTSDIHINNIHASLKNDAKLYCPSLILSCRQSRIECRVNLIGENSQAQIDGLTIGHNKSTSESLTRVMHGNINSSSNQTFRTILNDESRASFLGKIRVEAGADGTNADMSSKSLLLSENARANAKPELEILADDVKCSHGVTIGNFDPEQMFYLCSRGISQPEAKKLLINAFSKVVIENLPISLSKISEEFFGFDNFII
mgnify:FL=1